MTLQNTKTTDDSGAVPSLKLSDNGKKLMIAILLIFLLIQSWINLMAYKQMFVYYSKMSPSYGRISPIMTSNQKNRLKPEISFSNKTSTKTSSSRELCPITPLKLFGPLKVFTERLTFEEIEELYSWLEQGGRHRPEECLSRNKVAIIVPYRDRDTNLRIFLYNIHPVLKRQQLDYGVYIVEQDGDEKFNRGRLMNVGFLEALKQYDYQCFIFHDVDLIPEDDRILYTCPEKDSPRLMGVSLEQFGYELFYQEYFGGVIALTTEQFKRINGFSNEFWEWGGEDDDIYNRVRYYGYNITRYPAELARYKSLEHKKALHNPNEIYMVKSDQQRFRIDGINSTNYHVVEVVDEKLYTWILVDVGFP